MVAIVVTWLLLRFGSVLWKPVAGLEEKSVDFVMAGIILGYHGNQHPNGTTCVFLELKQLCSSGEIKVYYLAIAHSQETTDLYVPTDTTLKICVFEVSVLRVYIRVPPGSLLPMVHGVPCSCCTPSSSA